MEDMRFNRAEVLFEQKRFKEAEEILRELLREDPNDVNCLAFLAEAVIQRDDHAEALEIVNRAIGLAPDHPHLFFIKARVYGEQGDLDLSEKNIKQAITLYPHDADFFAYWAEIKLLSKDYKSALRISNQSLEIDPENLRGLNIRSSSLLKLKKNEESFETINRALREDPNNVYTHANFGWNLLELGDHKKALEHFNKALSIDPEYDYAQAGLAEALKATNLVYRLFLKYSFWISSMTEKYQWGFIIGFYFAFKILSRIAEANSGLRPFIVPVLVMLFVMAISTWVIKPIGNVFLRFSKYGQVLLDKNEKRTAGFVTTSLGIMLLGLLLYVTSGNGVFLSVVVFGFTMIIPLGLMYTPSKYKNAFMIYAIGMGIIGLLAVVLTMLFGALINPATLIYIIGLIAFQWIANFLMIRS